MSLFAGGVVGHNQISVNAFNQTSLVLLVLHVIMLILVIIYIDDKKKLKVNA